MKSVLQLKTQFKKLNNNLLFKCAKQNLNEEFKTFETWLIESKTLNNDSRGKLHELLVAAHLNNNLHGQLAHAYHFRDENGQTPEEAHNSIVKKISDNEYQIAHIHAKQAADAIYSHLKQHHPEILSNKNHEVRVSWTPIKSNHEKLTGKQDEAHSGLADIMLSSHDKHTGKFHHAVGYSLKIANNKITTAQIGSKTTEQILGMEPNSLQQHDENHKKDVNDIFKKYGYDSKNMSEAEKHEIFKNSRDNKTKIANEIRQSSYKHAAKKVNEIKKYLESLPENSQKSRLREFIAPSHTYSTYQVATLPKKKITNIKNEKDELVNKYSNSGKLSFHQSKGNGNSLLIKDQYGTTLHRIEIRSKRPVSNSEIMIK